MVASWSALPLVIFLEKNAMIGMPTPYCAPSALSSLMCTFFAGFDGVDEDDDEPEVVLELELPWLTVGLPCVVLELQAVRTRATAPVTTARARVDRKRVAGCTPTRYVNCALRP